MSADRKLAPVPTSWEPWDGTPLPKGELLHWGYTTGATVTAALVASWRAAQSKLAPNAPDTVDLLFGDGVVRTIPLSLALSDYPGFAVVRKNAGDDPDCTHGILVAGRIRPLAADEAPDARDVAIPVGEATVFVHAVCGVGLVTREGLDCAKDHWAINPGVVRMLASNLERSGLREGRFVAEVAIPQGEELSAKTLNHTLGVTGGLSLLGTTGLVRPFSHDAYVATIRIGLRCARKSTGTAVFCTGHRTQAGARQWCQDPANRKVVGSYPDVLPEEAYIAIADFVGDSVRAARETGMERVIVCCMPGKLLKYAAGHDNTHAHKVVQDLPLLQDILHKLFPEKRDLAPIFAAEPSMRGVMGHLSPAEQQSLYAYLAPLALDNLAELAGCAGESTRPAFGLLLTDFTGEPLAFFRDACWPAD